MKKIIFITMVFLIPCLFSSAQNSWSPKTNFAGTARNGAVGFSIGTKGYICAGEDSNNYKQDMWEWDQSNNSWTQKQDMPGPGRAFGVGFSIGDMGYFGTGEDFSNFYKDFYKYDPIANMWSAKADFPGTGNGRSYAVGFSVGSKGYIGTGMHFVSNVYKDFYEYDTTANSWAQKSDYPGAISGTYGATGFSIGNKGYIQSGNNFWQWDQANDTWIQKANYPGSEFYGVAFSIGNMGYIGSGFITGGGSQQDFWEYNSSTDIWRSRTNYLNITMTAVGFSICNKGYIGTGRDYYGNPVSSTFGEYSPSIAPGSGFTASQINVCIGTCIDFTDTSTNVPNSWHWDFGNGDTSNVQNPTNVCFPMLSSGSYLVTLTTKTNGNCTSTVSKSITVNHPNDNNPCTFDFCDSLTGIVSHLLVNVDDNNACTVDDCNTISGAITNIPVNYSDNDSCTIDACDALTGTITHTYSPIVNIGSDTIMQAGLFILDAGPGFNNYLWSTGDTTQTIQLILAGTYSVTVTGNNNCTASDAITITFTGINDFEKDEIKISPNPSSGNFYISLNENPVELNIEVYNIFGQLVYLESIDQFPENNMKEIKLGVKSDTYIVKMIYKNNILIKKLIINN